MSSPAVASLSTRQVRHALQALDGLRLPTVDSERLCRESGLSRAELEDPEVRIPYATLDTLLERAVELSGDDNLGLHMASLPVVDPDDVGSAVIATSPNLAESLERGARYQRVWGDGERLRFEQTSRGVRMRFTPVGAWRPAHRHMAEIEMAELPGSVRSALLSVHAVLRSSRARGLAGFAPEDAPERRRIGVADSSRDLVDR